MTQSFANQNALPSKTLLYTSLARRFLVSGVFSKPLLSNRLLKPLLQQHVNKISFFIMKIDGQSTTVL